MSEGLYERARFRTAGDRGLLVEYGDAIDPVINRKVRAMAIALGKEPPEGVLEVIPTYRSLLILYDPLLTTSSSVTSPNLTRAKPFRSNTLATSDLPEPVIPTIATTFFPRSFSI